MKQKIKEIECPKSTAEFNDSEFMGVLQVRKP